MNTPIADSWSFSKYIPDIEDAEASLKTQVPALSDYTDIHLSFRFAHLLNAYARGFNRGIAWEKYRAEYRREQPK